MNKCAPIHVVIASGTALLAASWGGAAAGAGDDVALFGKDPGSGNAFACYTRHYDKAHLAGHPKQNVVDMTLFVNSYVDADIGRQYALSIGVHFRPRPKLFELAGGCSSSVDGKNALNCGIDCDGGRIDIRVRDANSILVSIPDGAATWDAESEDEPPDNERFGSDDKLFRLDRTALPDCLPLVFDDDVKAEITGMK
jgi:hypothetical protein